MSVCVRKRDEVGAGLIGCENARGSQYMAPPPQYGSNHIAARQHLASTWASLR